MCLSNGVFHKGDAVVCPVDSTGCFTEEVTDFSGQYVKVKWTPSTPCADHTQITCRSHAYHMQIVKSIYSVCTSVMFVLVYYPLHS